MKLIARVAPFLAALLLAGCHAASTESQTGSRAEAPVVCSIWRRVKVMVLVSGCCW